MNDSILKQLENTQKSLLVTLDSILKYEYYINPVKTNSAQFYKIKTNIISIKAQIL